MDDIIELLEQMEKYEMSNKLDRLKDNAILSVDNFKRELERAGLMNVKLQEFIENYMKFDNKYY